MSYRYFDTMQIFCFSSYFCIFAIQSMIFGVVLDKTGSWPAIFITIAVLYVIMLVMVFIVRNMKMTKLEKAFAEG